MNRIVMAHGALWRIVAMAGRILAAMLMAAFGVGAVTSCQTGLESALPAAESVAVVARGSMNSATKSSEQVASVEELRTANQQLEEIAKAVAVVVADKETAVWLHKKCMERFDGETNVLWKQLDKDLTVPKARGTAGGWSERIANVLQSRGSALSSRSAVEQIIHLVEKVFDSNVHLYWYAAELWDRQSSPLIVLPPIGTPDGTDDLVAFDSQGRWYTVTKYDAHKYPVLVLTNNERTDAQGRLQAGTLITREDSKKSNGKVQTATPLQLHSAQFFDVARNSLDDW